MKKLVLLSLSWLLVAGFSTYLSADMMYCITDDDCQLPITCLDGFCYDSVEAEENIRACNGDNDCGTLQLQCLTEQMPDGEEVSVCV